MNHYDRSVPSQAPAPMLRAESFAARLPARLFPAAACALALAAAISGCGGASKQSGSRAPSRTPAGRPTQWSLSTRAFRNSGKIPPKYTCDGANVPPALSWAAPPKGTVEIALTCDDPDAPGGNFVHWVLYGMAPNLRALPEAVPASERVAKLGGAKQGRNDFGRIGYGGPCPPKGPPHHYHFRLYALDAKTGLLPGANEAALATAMEGHVVAQAELVGLYSR